MSILIGHKGYFEGNEKAEQAVVNHASKFDADEDPKGSGRYLLKIAVVLPKTPPATPTASDEELAQLSGQLLRNRSRIESNLLTAIRKLVAQNNAHWNASVIGKVVVEIEYVSP